MMTVAHALQQLIDSFRLTDPQQQVVNHQYRTLQQRLRERLPLVTDFLSGSYARGTSIRPLHDIDLFAVFQASARATYGAPGSLLGLVQGELEAGYVGKTARVQNRSVNIHFTQTGISFDVVPAFAEGGNYFIPERETGQWVLTNPLEHDALLKQAHRRSDQKLIPLIRVAKHWNRRQGEQKPLSSFHLEVMGHGALPSDPGGSAKGLRRLFTHLADAVQRRCPDPVHPSRHLDGYLDLGGNRRAVAHRLLAEAARVMDRVVELEHSRPAEAHFLLRELLGPEYPERGVPPGR